MRSRQEVVPLFPDVSLRTARGTSWAFADATSQNSFSLACYARVVWNRRWIVLTIALGVFVTVLFGTLRQKPHFRAMGALELQMPKGSVTSVGDLFQEGAAPENYLLTQAELLRSNALVSQVITKLQASGDLEVDRQPLDQGDAEALQDHLSADVLKGSRLIQVASESQSPDAAAKFVNQLMALYIEQTMAQRSETAQNASSWLLDQLNDTRAKLEQATVALQRYETAHSLIFVETKNGGTQSIESQRLQQLQLDVDRARTLRIEKESLSKLVQSGDTSVLHSVHLEELTGKESAIRHKLAQLSEKFGPNFPEVRQNEEQLEEIRSDEAAERTHLTGMIAAELDSATRQEALLHRAFEDQQALVNGASQQVLQDGILKRDVDLDKQLYEGLLRQMNEAGVSSKLAASNARIVEPAKLPLTRIGPRILYNLILGIFAGLSLGMGFAFLQEHLQDTFQSSDDVETHLNLPLLASIPTAPIRNSSSYGWSYTGDGATLTLSDGAPDGQHSPDLWFRLDRDGQHHFEVAEAIRNLRTSLLFASDGAHPRSILISSAVPSEGKTTISANLSVALAQLGKRVLSIDGDLRRPSIHRVFSMANCTGLADYLQGRREWQSIVSPSGVAGLNVIVSGGRPRDPAELLSSDRMEELVRQAMMQYDVVIVDSPTLLNMADSRVLASYVDAVVLVVKSGATPKKLVKQAFTNLHSVSARVIGVVLNQVDMHSEEYSSSYSSYSPAADLARQKST